MVKLILGVSQQSNSLRDWVWWVRRHGKRKHPIPKYLFGLLAAWCPALTKVWVCEVPVTWGYISPPKIFLQYLYAFFMGLLWTIAVTSPQDKSAINRLAVKGRNLLVPFGLTARANPGPFWLSVDKTSRSA